MATTDTKKDKNAAETAEVLPGEEYITADEFDALVARVTALETAPKSGSDFKATTDPNNPVWKGWVPAMQGHVHG